MPAPLPVRSPTASTVRRLLSRTLVWDNHGCMPLRPEDLSFLPSLARYRKSGVRAVGIVLTKRTRLVWKGRWSSS